VRLSETGRRFLEGAPLGESEVAEGMRFYTQPNFEVLAPAGLPLPVVFRVGQIAEFTSVDRMNTYTLTRESVRDALDRGWRRDELLDFLGGDSAMGLPQNVRSTVEDWMGNHGEVEFHDALVLTVRADREAEVVDILRKRRSLAVRLGPGVYAVPREDRDAVLKLLRNKGYEPSPWLRRYDREAPAGEAPTRLRELLARVEGGVVQGTEPGADAMEYPVRQLVVLQPPSAETTAPEEQQQGTVALNGDGRAIASMVNDLCRKPGAAGSGDLLKLSPGKTSDLLRAAISRGHDVEILYRTPAEESVTGSTTGLLRVSPKALTQSQGVACLQAFDHKRAQESLFIIKKIQGIRLSREKD